MAKNVHDFERYIEEQMQQLRAIQKWRANGNATEHIRSMKNDFTLLSQSAILKVKCKIRNSYSFRWCWTKSHKRNHSKFGVDAVCCYCYIHTHTHTPISVLRTAEHLKFKYFPWNSHTRYTTNDYTSQLLSVPFSAAKIVSLSTIGSNTPTWMNFIRYSSLRTKTIRIL